MKLVFLFFLAMLGSEPLWHINLNEAKEIAKKDHKYILLNFSGSDWCGPCIRMREEIFNNSAFAQMADTQLVLVNADFPRKKKNQPSNQQQETNNKMADQYNPQGKFPYTVLLDANGRVLKTWDGLPDETADKFTNEVRYGIFASQ